jgi:hypothetical protein
MKSKILLACTVANILCLSATITTKVTVSLVRDYWNRDSVKPSVVEVLEAKTKRKPPKRRVITSLPDNVEPIASEEE